MRSPQSLRVAADSQFQRLFALPHCALNITTRCQQRCAFCFEGEHGVGRDLPLADVLGLVERVREQVTGVIYMGAESTLHRQFVEVLAGTSARGLIPMVSTNLLRFADAAFLERCVAAGLRVVEFSFHYPDAAALARDTCTHAGNFDRLGRAMENLSAVSRRPGSPLIGANVNVVVHQHNVERLDEVVAQLDRHLGPGFFLLTWKMLQTTVGGPRARPLDASWSPDPEAMRRSLVRVLDGWSRAALPIFRGYPLCLAPGYAHLNADLSYHCRRTPLFHNFERPDAISRMYDYDPVRPAAGIPAACAGCSLRALCLVVTRGQAALALPGLRPEPSAAAPAEVLAGCGLGVDEAAAFLERCEQQAGPEPSAPRSRVEIRPWLRQRSIWTAVEHLAAGRPLRAPVTVELHLGTECNLACPECVSHPLPGPGRFEPGRALALAGELVDLGVRCVVLSGGGEPLLHPSAGAVLQALARAGVATALVTNATLLDAHLEPIAESVARVRVSVDAATAATHGRFRPRRAGGECFPKVVANLGALARVMRGQLTFSFLVISRRAGGVVESNAGEIVAAARLAREAGCHAFDVSLAFDGRPWIDPAHAAVAPVLAEQLARVRELDGPGFRVCVSDLVADVAAGRAAPMPAPRGYARCPAAEIRAVVAPGGVFLCPRHMSLPAARYGDPVTTPLADIWASAARRAALEAVDPRRCCAGACMSMGLNDELLRAIDEARSGRRLEVLPDTDLFL